MQRNEKPLFIYQGPHYVHAEWARSVNCKFINFRLHRKFKNLKIAKATMRALLVLLRKPKFVISEGGAPLTEAALVKIAKNTPLVYLATDTTPWQMINTADEYIRGITEIADLVVANSKMILNDLLKYCKLKKYAVVYPFVRDEIFSYGQIDAKKDEKKGIFVGSLMKHKGAHFLPEIATRIRKKVEDFKLIAVGRPTNVILKETEALKLAGYLHTNALIYELLSAKVYIHPALYEPFGVSIAESIVLGTIPVVTSHTGIKEFLPRDLVANSMEDLIEKAIYILELNFSDYRELLFKIRSKIGRKIRKNVSISNFKSAVLTFEK